jgi:polyisoprenoid-binding protein YceI
MEMAVRTHPTIFRIARCLCGLLALGGLAQAPTPAGATARWVINPDRTHIIFAIDAVGYPRTLGEFRQFEGWIEVDLEHPDTSSVAFHALSRSVDVGSR